jgi:16S rRNA (cytosine967-C5)-methyltransferase
MNARSHRSHGARGVAVRVLNQVFKESEYVSACLNRELMQAPAMDARDRALATELCYGVVRTRTELERRLLEFAPRGIAGGDLTVLNILLVAAYQLLFLTRIPAFAAVNEAVAMIGELRGKQVAGFANALLRKLQVRPAGPNPTLSEAILASAPPWLMNGMTAAVGEDGALALLGLSDDTHETTPTCVRFKRHVALPKWVNGGEPGRLCKGVYRFRRAGDVRKQPEYSAGHFVVQEEGACFAAHALGVLPHHRVLDACAGRGQKSTLFAEQLAGNGELWTTDVSASKLDALQREFVRLELPQPTIRVQDWRYDATDIPTNFDRILVDAPCTGTGTLRRRPEIARRLSAEDVERLAQLAESILRQAAKHLAHGGRLLFVVCSVLERECETLRLAVQDLLVPADFDAPEVIEITGAATTFRLAPATHDVDGFYLAMFTRKH